MSEEPDRIYDPRRVEPVTWDVAAPKRVSVTLVKKADACPRDAAFYLRYGGGAQTGPLLRGSLFHLFAEKAMSMLMVHGERTLFAAQEGEDPVLAAQEVSQTTKEWVDELVEETGWPVCEADVDDVREMAYHFAVGNDVDPETVIACERKFVLETPDGTLSGKVDLAALPPDNVLDVVDYKSSFAVPPQDDFDRMVQVPLYAVLILWGNPVEKRPCGECEGRGHVIQPHAGGDALVACEPCNGRGSIEEVLPPLGLDDVQWVRARQVYPRFLRDGVMSYRERMIGRADLRDALAAAQRAMRRVNRGAETRVWPAVSGAHCSECTCEAECPLPRQLRRFAGAINTVEQASEAMEWWERQSSLAAATRTEVVKFVKAREELAGELAVGNRVYSLQVSHSTAVKRSKGRSDWDGLRDAVQEAAEFGEPFDVNDWLRSQTKTEFKPKKEDA
jgi:RecB family exonuclease